MTAAITVSGREVEFDTVAAGYNEAYPIAVSVEHHKIHEGRHFIAQDIDTSIDTGSPKYWLIKAPNTATRCHMTFQIRTGGPGIVEGFKGSTTSADGTQLTASNSDFNSSNTPECEHYYDPTVSADGTRVCVNWLGTDGASPVGDTGGAAQRSMEFILAQNGKMLVKFTPSNDGTPASICFDWYEVPDNSTG